jgi:hypothetical protein
VLLLGQALARCLYSEDVGRQSGSFYEVQCSIKQGMSSHRARRSPKQQLDRSGTRARTVEWRGSRGPVHKEFLVLVSVQPALNKSSTEVAISMGEIAKAEMLVKLHRCGRETT